MREGKFYKTINIPYKQVWILPVLSFISWVQFQDSDYIGASLMLLVTFLCLYGAFHTLIDRRVYLSISETGIFFRYFSFGLISWSDIKTISLQEKYLSNSSNETTYNDVLLIDLINKEIYLDKLPAFIKYLPLYKKDSFELDLKNLTTNSDKVLEHLRKYLPKEKILDKKRRQQLEQDINKEVREKAIKYGQAFAVDGEVYISKNDMPNDVRKKHDEQEAVIKSMHNQTKKFRVNGIEYETFTDIPEKYKDEMHDMMERSGHDGTFSLQTND